MLCYANTDILIELFDFPEGALSLLQTRSDQSGVFSWKPSFCHCHARWTLLLLGSSVGKHRAKLHSDSWASSLLCLDWNLYTRVDPGEKSACCLRLCCTLEYLHLSAEHYLILYTAARFLCRFLMVQTVCGLHDLVLVVSKTPQSLKLPLFVLYTPLLRAQAFFLLSFLLCCLFTSLLSLSADALK